MPSWGNITLEKELIIKIRNNYDHDSQLQNFINYDLPSFEYDGASNFVLNNLDKLNKNRIKLLASKEYRIKVFKLNTVCWFEDYINFFKEDGALLTGTHGLTYLAQEYKEVFFEKPCRYITLAEKDFLPKQSFDSNSKRIIPIITNYPGDAQQMKSEDNRFYFDYLFFNSDVDPNKIICFYNKE